MTPHSVRLYEGVPKSHALSVVPDTVLLTAGASTDARVDDEAQTAQLPAHRPLMLHTEEPLPGEVDQIAVVTMMCVVRELSERVARLEKQVKDINYREAV